MRATSLLLIASLSTFALHCSSEEPQHPTKDDQVVENHPGALAITSPARAAFIADDGTSVTVQGTGASRELTINGVKADVAADGSFRADIKPTPGLNVVVAVDGESRLESPFLFGRFVKQGTSVQQAVALDLGAQGLTAPAPAASLASVANLALAQRDLIAAIRGKSFGGSVLGASWTFAVTGGHHAQPTIALTAKRPGPSVVATVANVAVDGTLSILGFSRPVSLTVDLATVTGDSDISVDPANGALRVAMPKSDAKLDGFKVDSNNAGFPCCVDSIATNYLRPKVEETIRDAIRDQLGSALEVTLDGIGLPKQLDLHSVGVSKPLAIQTRFDGATFDEAGGSLSVAALFGGPFAADAPGAQVPGWLALGKERATPRRSGALGVSISLDAVNQMLFAAWGAGGLELDVASLNAKLSPKMPPVVTITETGALRVGLGEIVAQRPNEGPLAAITVMQDVGASADDTGIVLTPQGEPKLSITWLNETAATGGAIIAAGAKDQLQQMLKPFHVPLPKIPLDKLGGGLAGQSLALGSTRISIDVAAARIEASGAMTLVKK